MNFEMTYCLFQLELGIIGTCCGRNTQKNIQRFVPNKLRLKCPRTCEHFPCCERLKEKIQLKLHDGREKVLNSKEFVGDTYFLAMI